MDATASACAAYKVIHLSWYNKLPSLHCDELCLGEALILLLPLLVYVIDLAGLRIAEDGGMRALMNAHINSAPFATIALHIYCWRAISDTVHFRRIQYCAHSFSLCPTDALDGCHALGERHICWLLKTVIYAHGLA